MGTTPAVTTASGTALDGVWTSILAGYLMHGKGILHVANNGLVPADFEVALSLDGVIYTVAADLTMALAEVAAADGRDVMLQDLRPPYIRVRARGTGGDASVTVELHRPPQFSAYPLATT